MSKRPHWATEILGADLRSLAVLRIWLGFMLFWDLVLRSRDLVAFYTDYGVLPRQALLDLGWNPAYVSIHMMSGHWFVMLLLFVVGAVASLAMMVGWQTRWSTLVAWFFLISLQNRNPLVLNGGDILIRVILFWGLFLPWGARWSLDARANPQWRELPNHLYSAATVAYLAQICVVYLFAAILKTGPHWHQDGTAVYYALSLDQFTSWVGRFVYQFPELCKLLTHATWWFEALAPLMLVFPFWNGPIRTLGVFGISMMHFGFGACMHIGVFSPIGMGMVLGLLPAWFWERLGERRWFDLQGLADRLPPSPLRSELPPNYRLGLVVSALVTLLTFYMILWNIGTTRGKYRVPARLEWLGIAVKLDQMWNMFAPYPLIEDGWYVVDANLRNGTKVDLLTGRPVTFEKPEWVSATYKNERWRKYMMNLWMRDYSAYRLYFGRFLCRSWNDKHPDTEDVTTFELSYMLEKTLPDYQKPEVEKVVIWSHDCFKRD
jgi:hypothetical protein